MHKVLDAGSLVIAILTLVLFVAALFTKGFTHDLFLEVGVFLVSVKLIVMAYKNSIAVNDLNRKLDEILRSLECRDTGTSAGDESPLQREKD